MYKAALLFPLVFCLVYAKHEQYDGHILYKVEVSNEEQAQQIHALENELGLDIWSHAAPARGGLVLVPGLLRQSFEKAVLYVGAQYEIQIGNIKEALEMEDQLLSAGIKRSNRTDGRLSFDAIPSYAEVDAYLVELARKYPSVSVVSGGRSFEGRDIKYLKISSNNFQDARKPIIMIQSLIHAREWISLPASLYAIEKLVVDISDRDLVDQIDWIILPIVNPDGYEFTHSSSRFWRKNRATGYMIGNICLGVDLNRNFDFNWGTASSGSVCSDTFHGRGAFSEPETALIRNIIEQYQRRLELYIDIHSFGSLILYGYGSGVLPPNALTLNVVGVGMAAAIDAVKWASKPNYRVGNSALTLYEVSGGSSDYVQSMGVPFSYAFELPAYRNQAGSLNGFLVDPEFIEQAGFETWEGIKVGARFVLQHSRSKK